MKWQKKAPGLYVSGKYKIVKIMGTRFARGNTTPWVVYVDNKQHEISHTTLRDAKEWVDDAERIREANDKSGDSDKSGEAS